MNIIFKMHPKDQKSIYAIGSYKDFAVRPSRLEMNHTRENDRHHTLKERECQN